MNRDNNEYSNTTRMVLATHSTSALSIHYQTVIPLAKSASLVSRVRPITNDESSFEKN